MRFEFEAWLEANYPKVDDNNNPIGAFTASEIGRSMHRGYPADKILLDMMGEIHRYFGFPQEEQDGGWPGRRTQRLYRLHHAYDERQRP